jgi:hypothetical protein
MTRMKRDCRNLFLFCLLPNPVNFGQESHLLSKETLERYRRMTTSERLRLTLHSIEENEPALLYGKADVVGRRFELLARENRGRVENILKGLARSVERECQPDQGD